ncbi:Rieske (2Fe-2S) protein [Pelagicoccus sp. SDUM812005]|uniref:QcrA and Rieske domain-containing protein n=1 Tax=Pelagicoccus sp. SDUM812005 TaxID=3041257 RepID=UPI0028102349|nr:Rieske (2Fe-2S) protein [Pelagicoccus sp. SDUM812005]MDQ8183270.1 Rieske (2Fe-2S) protein [Pelagicoccus sp. SDUM812005]
MSDQTTPSEPAWKTQYPIRQTAEHKTSRRGFTKLIGASLLAAAGGYLIKDKLFTHPISGPKTVVAKVGELEVGASKLFKYPETQPCILIRLAENEYVAYSQACTHLMCPVHYDGAKQQIVCPCHSGYFDAKTGAVLAGPPPRPLPRYKVTVEGEQIIVG